MRHGSLFSGIGGFDLAAEWMGWENVFHCEWNTFGQKVLHHYWPKTIQYNDITKTDFTIHRGKIDILTGGFPCQPYSSAGKRKGKQDERHLWPEMLRAIREIQPRWVVGENVLGLVNWSGGLVFHEVQTNLEAAGYEVWAYVLPAVSVNAPHRRDRVWFVAYGKSYGFKQRINKWKEHQFQNRDEIRNIINTNGKESTTPHPNSNRFNQRNGNDEEQPSEGWEYAQHDIKPITIDTKCTGRIKEWNDNGFFETAQQAKRREQQFSRADSAQSWWRNFPSQSPVCTGDDGLSTRLDGITFSKWRNESIKAAVNAIVPQVVLPIFKAIQEYESLITSQSELN